MREALKADERAWVSLIQPQGSTWTVGEDPRITPLVQNTGKTPATDISGDFYIEILSNDTAPHFDAPGGHTQMSAGIYYPNAPQPVPVFRVKSESTPDKYVGNPLTQEEKQALESNKAWFVVHGKLKYRDVFGDWHFTQFCMSDPRNRPLTSVSQICSSHNDVDR